METFGQEVSPISAARLFAVSAVVMGLSYTITKERLFAPLRDRLGGKETWAGYLVSCPYCASHWIAFVVVPLTGAYFVPVSVRWGWLSAVLTWFLSSILVTVVAAFLRIGFFLLDEGQGLVRRKQRTEEEATAAQRLVKEKLAEEEQRVH